MKRTLLPLLAATTILSLPALASAQSWVRVEDRADQLSQRIDAGIRSGQITEREAAGLRSEIRDVVRLEERYSSNGLTPSERADLDRRFDMISTRVYAERRDGDRRYAGGQYNDRYADARQGGRWDNLNQRQRMFNQRLRQAVVDHRITQRQADNLRFEFRRIANLEQQYRRDGLSPSERADLDARMDRLQLSFRQQVNANQYGYGYGQAPNLFDYLFGIR